MFCLIDMKKKRDSTTRFTPIVPRPLYAIEVLEQKLKELVLHVPILKENTEEARKQYNADYYEIISRINNLHNSIKILKNERN